jgi:DNA-binding transcriptional regulator YiaG
MSVWAEKIIRLRQILGLSQEGFARRIRVSSRTVWRWEESLTIPMGLYAEKLERMFKKYLVDNEKEKA